MSKLTKEQVEAYPRDVQQAMAQDIAARKFGKSTAESLKNAHSSTLVLFIMDNQDG